MLSYIIMRLSLLKAEYAIRKPMEEPYGGAAAGAETGSAFLVNGTTMPMGEFSFYAIVMAAVVYEMLIRNIED